MCARQAGYDAGKPALIERNRVGMVSGQLYVYGWSGRKLEILQQFCRGTVIKKITDVTVMTSGDVLVLWGSTVVPRGVRSAVQIIRVEDGFIRSVGLGADLVQPLSWIFDHHGIYYDATRPSHLEILLQDTAFSPELINRARQLRQRIVAGGVTKYNVGTGDWVAPTNKKSILVAGQVETDASIKFGASGIHTNIALLQAVRQNNPDAHIVYKPHPDVVAGLRAQGQGENAAQALCDEIVLDVPMHTILASITEVHVMTSLTGFEALLRGIPVICHGQPFYSGWGLTTDMLPLSRRSRRCTLDELVAATLILYPSYISRHTAQLITVEQALDELQKWRVERQWIPAWGRELVRKVLRRVVGVR